ncbi:TPA: hypothetical protein U1W10_001145 [Streptococcus suis]|nr:hypothetical protein [Streptococcus suis]HEM4051143.1 hypothetical protein [Streptococcus suis]
MLDFDSDDTLGIYDEVLMETTSKPICLVEGNNKFFYQQIKELHPYLVDDGGNCTDIIRKVGREKYKLGIIDNDYRDKNEQIDNIIKIDYYSIENIVLEKIPEFNCLIEILKAEKLEELILHDIKVCFYPKDRENKEFTLSLGRRYQKEERIKYVQSEITSFAFLVKYKNLKIAVESTNRYISMKLHKKIQIINDLHNYIDEKSIKEILSREEYERFLKTSASILSENN